MLARVGVGKDNRKSKNPLAFAKGVFFGPSTPF